jgi:predicted nucleic acid-binding protein
VILRLVVDASIAVAWIHPAQATPATSDLLDAVAEGAEFVVPSLWSLEVANALLVLCRRRKLSEQDRAEGLKWLQRLPTQRDDEAAGLAFGRLSELASEQGLSVYDAVYLEVAQRRGLPFACKDGPLRVAAERIGIELYG